MNMTITQFLKPKGDKAMWLIILMLSLWGLLAVYSSVSWLAYKNQISAFLYLLQHGFYIFIGFIIMLYLHTIHYKNFMGIAKFLLYISYALLIATILFGVTINGAKRWISFGVFTFQSSDFSKVAILLYTIRTLAKNKDNLDDMKGVIYPLLGHITVTCVLIGKDNLSTALILFVTCFLMLFLGRVRIVHLLKIGGSAIVLILLFGLFIVLAPTPIISKMGRMETWQGRLKTFVAKTDTNKKYGDNIEIKDENNFQANHAKIAIDSGCLLYTSPSPRDRQKSRMPSSA